MVRNLARVAAAAVGLFGLVMGIHFWIDPIAAGAILGISGQGVLGLATLRADLGSLFGVSAILSFAAAYRADDKYLIAPILLFALALLGRFLTVIVNGMAPVEVQPMAVEAILVAVLVLSHRALRVQ